MMIVKIDLSKVRLSRYGAVSVLALAAHSFDNTTNWGVYIELLNTGFEG